MLRNVKGGPPNVTTKAAVAAACEGLTKTKDEYRYKVFNEHVPELTCWIKSVSEGIRRQIELGAQSHAQKPPCKKHKLSPVAEKEFKTDLHSKSSLSPSRCLPQEELDRVYNLRVRDLQKELLKEKVDFKLKWNKKQLQDFYLKLLVQKIQDVQTQPKKLEVFEEVKQEEVKQASIPQVGLIYRDGDENIGSKGFNATFDSDKGEIMQNDEYDTKFQSNIEEVEEMSVESIPPTLSHNSQTSSRQVLEKALNSQSYVEACYPSNMSAENLEPCGEDFSSQNADIYETKKIITQPLDVSLNVPFEQEVKKDEPKVKITEVKKGMVANIKAAYMEAAESKKPDFSMNRTPGSLRKHRSPLQTIVQSGMQSAKRILSPKTKPMNVSPNSEFHSKANVIDKNMSFHNPRDELKVLSKQLENVDLPESNRENEMKNVMKSATMTNVADGPSMTTSESSAFKSSAAKATSEARKAKIAEMRSKSKIAAASSRPHTKIGEVKEDVSIPASELETQKKQTIAAQMRAKHHGLSQTVNSIPSVTIAKNSEPPAIKPSAVPDKPLASSITTMPSKMSLTKHVSSEKKSQKEDNYEISDTEGSSDEEDEGSDSDSSESSKRKKKIPGWAQKEQLQNQLEKQFRRDGYPIIDPDELFGEVETCDLKQIFGSPKAAKYKKRTSTGNWTKDRVTAAEKLAYKRTCKILS